MPRTHPPTHPDTNPHPPTKQFMTAMASSSNGQNGGQPQYRSYSGFDRFHQMDVAVERFRRCVSLFLCLYVGADANVVLRAGREGHDRPARPETGHQRKTISNLPKPPNTNQNSFATEKNVHVMLVVHPRKESDQLRLGISSISGTAKATQVGTTLFLLCVYRRTWMRRLRHGHPPDRPYPPPIHSRTTPNLQPTHAPIRTRTM